MRSKDVIGEPPRSSSAAIRSPSGWSFASPATYRTSTPTMAPMVALASSDSSDTWATVNVDTT